jgi:rare lipoprotein A
MTRKSRKLSLKTPLRIYLLAGASSVALVALVALFVTRTVQADAGLRPATTAPAISLAASATPATLTSPKPLPLKEIGKQHRLHGLASWYGGIFDGRTTASGEPYDMNAMTACHPTLPFGSIVRVINRINHRSVVVRINDRGDLVDQKRIIDLSYGAAQKLAMVDSGLAPVDVQVLSMGNGR